MPRQHLFNMKIDGKKISISILGHLKKEIKSLSLKSKKTRLRPKLVVFSVKGQPQDISFVRTKEKTIRSIGGDFALFHSTRTPRFEDFANKLKDVAENVQTTSVVIQQPLPSSLSTDSLYNYIPTVKEIEGHKKKSPFYPPIGLAVLTILKYIYKPGSKKKVVELIVDIKKDQAFLKKILKRKKIVLIGRGETGGKPIGHVLSELKINFINTNSKTPNANFFYKDADIIISAVGRRVISGEVLKNGVVLISVGIRQENGQWKGDYDEDSIKNVAGFYTPTPGGIGPLDISYLMYNIVQATKIQAKRLSFK